MVETGIWIDHVNKTVLTSIPSPPPDYINLTDLRATTTLGVYLVGSDQFEVGNVHLTSVLRRKTGGKGEEFILGILSVFLIAILSEIVHVVLLRSRRETRMAPTSFVYAALVDELSHFRNVWTHFAVRRQGERGLRRRQAMISLVVIVITIGLFLADVLAVLLTQPVTTESKEHEYNLVAFNPVGATRGRARFVRRLSQERVCVSPIITGGDQLRKYMIGACIRVEEMSKDTPGDDVITVSSWFHKGGSDFEVTFGGGMFTISTRVQLLLDSEKGGTRRILFSNLDDERMLQSRYVHDRFIYACMEWMCNKKDTTRTCEQVITDLDIIQSDSETRTIKLWRGKTDDVNVTVKGLSTTYKIALDNTRGAVNSGVRELIATSAIREVRGNATYVTVANDKMETGIPGLVTEEGRVAGVWLFCILFAVFFVSMVALRMCLTPTSIASVALEQIEEEGWVEGWEEQQPEQQFPRIESYDTVWTE